MYLLYLLQISSDEGESKMGFSANKICPRLFKSSSTTVWLEAALANVLPPLPLRRRRRLPHHHRHHRPRHPLRHPCLLRLHLQLVREPMSLPTCRTLPLTRLVCKSSCSVDLNK